MSSNSLKFKKREKKEIGSVGASMSSYLIDGKESKKTFLSPLMKVSTLELYNLRGSEVPSVPTRVMKTDEVVPLCDL